MSERWEPTPIPSGDGRHDIGDETRAAIVNRLMDDWSSDPDLSPEKVRQLAMWAGASIRALLNELGTLRDFALLGSGNQATSAERAQATPQERSAQNTLSHHLPASSAVEQAREEVITDALEMARQVRYEDDHHGIGALDRLKKSVDALLASVVQPYEEEINAAYLRGLTTHEAMRKGLAITIERLRERAERAEAALKDKESQ